MACHTRQAGGNWLYDMGNAQTPVQPGFRKVGPADRYSAEKGFGWLTPPGRAFDSTDKPLPQLFLKDGIAGTDSLVFRTDLPNGDYFVTVTVGGPPTDTMTMNVSVNGEFLPDTLTTPWHRLFYRTIRRRIGIKEGKAVIKIAAIKAALNTTNAPTPNAPDVTVGVYAITIKPVTGQLPIAFTTPLEEDSMAVHQFAETLRKKVADDPGDMAAVNQLQNVDDYLLACYDYEGAGWSWAVKKTHMSLIYRLYAVVDLLEQIIADPSDPLYNRSVYLLAKTYYWLNQEDDDLYHGDLYNKYFNELKKKYPRDPLLRMYTGEQLFVPPDFDTTAGDAPKWARLERETMNRLLKVVHWWVEKKQIANGEMGGKYGDDVELLRNWLPAILGADDSIARAGYDRLANGVWNSDALDRGFARQVDDVEHSAELFRDTHPSLFLMHYGNPEYVERCLISMQNFRDVWTGVTPLGHRHFKSYYLSSTKVLSGPLYGIDVALNARAILPGLWAAWYNGNPAIVTSFSEWCDAWVADAARTDNGKPAGILPSAVTFSTDRIGGESSEWYDAHLTYDYYRWDHIGHVGELQYHLLGMYDITKNRNFLKPLNDYAAIMKAAEREITARKDSSSLKSGKPGSFEWVKYLLLTGGIDHEAGVNPMGKIFTMAGKILQTTAYDSLIAKYGEPYDRYQVTKDRREIEKGFEELLGSLSYNFPLLTSEVKFTDRVDIPGSNLLVGLCTGHFGAGYEYPSLVATWRNTGPGVSIFVHRGNKTSAAISLYNFDPEKQVGMRTWQLEPGVYVIKKGLDPNDDEVADQWLTIDTVVLKERVNDISIRLPSRKTILLSVQQLRSFGPAPVDCPDPALTQNDITLAGPATAGRQVEVACKVHNIGRRTAQRVIVEFLADHKKVGTDTIPAIAAPNDLVPKWAMAHFRWLPQAGRHTLTFRVMSRQKEITGLNNEAEKVVEVSPH